MTGRVSPQAFFLRLYFAIIASSFVLLGASSDRGPSSEIDVTIINCFQDASITPRLRLVRWPSGGESLNGFPAQVLAASPTAQPGIFSLALTEEVGNYSIGASTPHCQTREPTEVPLYATHSRHILLAPSASCCNISDSYPGSIAVSAPPGVWVGLYKISQGRSLQYRFGTIDDNVTYFVSVAPGSYEIVVSASGADACIPIVLPQTLHATQHYIELGPMELAALLRAKHPCSDAATNHWHGQNAPSQSVFPLKAGMLTLLLPSASIYERQTDVRPQFSEFTFYDTASKSPLFNLAEGTGHYDFKKFTKICLNGRQAWRVDSGGSGTAVVGEPGSWVSVSWSGLSGDYLSEVRTIVLSMSVNFGPKC